MAATICETSSSASSASFTRATTPPSTTLSARLIRLSQVARSTQQSTSSDAKLQYHLRGLEAILLSPLSPPTTSSSNPTQRSESLDETFAKTLPPTPTPTSFNASYLSPTFDINEADAEAAQTRSILDLSSSVSSSQENTTSSSKSESRDDATGEYLCALLSTMQDETARLRARLEESRRLQASLILTLEKMQEEKEKTIEREIKHENESDKLDSRHEESCEARAAVSSEITTMTNGIVASSQSPISDSTASNTYNDNDNDSFTSFVSPDPPLPPPQTTISTSTSTATPTPTPDPTLVLEALTGTIHGLESWLSHFRSTYHSSVHSQTHSATKRKRGRRKEKGSEGQSDGNGVEVLLEGIEGWMRGWRDLEVGLRGGL